MTQVTQGHDPILGATVEATVSSTSDGTSTTLELFDNGSGKLYSLYEFKLITNQNLQFWSTGIVLSNFYLQNCLFCNFCLQFAATCAHPSVDECLLLSQTPQQNH